MKHPIYTYVASVALLLGMAEGLRAQSLFIANNGSGTIGEYTTSGTQINANVVSGLNHPGGLAISGGNLFVVQAGSSTIGAYTTAGDTVNASLISGINGGEGIAISGANLLVANYSSGSVGEYTTSGTTIAASLISGLNGPTGLAISGNNLFVANYDLGTIGEFTTSGTTVNRNLISGLDGAFGIAISGTDLYVANWVSGTIGRYTTSGTVVNPSLITGLGMDNPTYLAISGNNLFVANWGTGTIGEYTTSGDTINTALISGLDKPMGIAIEPAPEPGTIALAGVVALLLLAGHRCQKQDIISKPLGAGIYCPAIPRLLAAGSHLPPAIEFAKAAAMRPQIVGLALKKISQDPDISHALFAVLETQNIIDGQANITLIPRNSELLGQLVAATQTPKADR